MDRGRQSGPLSLLVDALLAETQRAETSFHVLQHKTFQAAAVDLGVEALVPLLAIDKMALSFWLRPIRPSLLRRMWPWADRRPAEFAFAESPQQRGSLQVTIEFRRRDGKWQASVQSPQELEGAKVPLIAVEKGSDA